MNAAVTSKFPTPLLVDLDLWPVHGPLLSHLREQRDKLRKEGSEYVVVAYDGPDGPLWAIARYSTGQTGPSDEQLHAIYQELGCPKPSNGQTPFQWLEVKK